MVDVLRPLCLIPPTRGCKPTQVLAVTGFTGDRRGHDTRQMQPGGLRCPHYRVNRGGMTGGVRRDALGHPRSAHLKLWLY